MGWYLIKNENLSSGKTWQYFSADDYQTGVIHKRWTLWKKMFDFYHPHAYVFATEAEARAVMRCLGNFCPPMLRKMQVLSKEFVEQTLIQKMLSLS